MARPSTAGPKKRWIDLRPASLFLLVPIAISALTFTVVGTGLYEFHLANQTAKRLQTNHWEDAADAMGPGVATAELPQWLRDAGYVDVEIRRSGPMAYFHAVRA